MKKTRQEQIEELQEKVFGKNAPSRKVPSMNDMMEQARKIETDLDHLTQAKQDVDFAFSSVQNNNQSIQTMLDQQTKEIQEMTSCHEVNKDLESLETELEKDFSVQTTDFTSLEEKVCQDVVEQKQAIKECVLAFKRPYVLKNEQIHCLNSILLLGPKGSGKHTILKSIAQHINSEIVTIDLSKYTSLEDEKLFLQDIYSALNIKNSILVFENPETFFNGFLTMLTHLFKEGKIELKKRYIENKGQLQEINSSFVSKAISSLNGDGHYLVLISSLNKSKLTDILGIEFMNSITDVIETQPADQYVTELIQLSVSNLKTRLQNTFTIEIDEQVQQYYQSHYRPSLGGKSLEMISDKIVQALQQYKLENEQACEIKLTMDPDLIIIDQDNRVSVDTLLEKDSGSDLDEIKKELEEIVGLQEVKKYVLSLEDNYKIQKLREQKGLKNASISKHMIFTGNPGTGKTTIARLISRYLRAIGVLSGGQCIEVTRADLVGKYVGHTAPLTTQIIQSALGGVLFIDEAYSLYRGKDDSFGLECIDALVKGIEDHRDNLVVILAGYKKEMDVFLESNSGLKSRFPNIIDFKDYTADELVLISHSYAKSKDYYIDEECDPVLHDYYDKIQKDDAQMSGNGRMARNKVEEAILQQSTRILHDENMDLQQLKLCDFQLDESSFVR